MSPDCGPVGVETTVSGRPVITTLSSPPEPPSATPETLAPGWNTNVSWLSGAPERFSKPENATVPTVPLPVPVTFHVVLVLGPLRVSVPAPPAKTTGIGAATSDGSIVKESSPLPPVTLSVETDVRGCDFVEPSIVTATVPLVTEAVMEWLAPSGAVTVQAAGAVVVVVAVAVVVVVVVVVVVAVATGAGAALELSVVVVVVGAAAADVSAGGAGSGAVEA